MPTSFLPRHVRVNVLLEPLEVAFEVSGVATLHDADEHQPARHRWKTKVLLPVVTHGDTHHEEALGTISPACVVTHESHEPVGSCAVLARVDLVDSIERGESPSRNRLHHLAADLVVDVQLESLRTRLGRELVRTLGVGKRLRLSHELGRADSNNGTVFPSAEVHSCFCTAIEANAVLDIPATDRAGHAAS